jgi:CO dehydrogenase nickel-insertion accessory protein CooC1
VLGQIEVNPDERRPLVVIADMEAGLGNLSRMGEGALDVAVLVTDVSPKAIEVVRRAQEMIAERKVAVSVVVVANRLQREEDLRRIHDGLGQIDLVPVPEDEEVRKADVHGLSPVDALPPSPAVLAVAALARRWPPRQAA